MFNHSRGVKLSVLFKNINPKDVYMRGEKRNKINIIDDKNITRKKR